MCSPSPPPPPDVIGQANAQGAANEQAARVQGHINNPNVVGPGSSRNVTWDGDTPTVTTTLSPEEQAIYNQNVQTRGALGQLGTQGATSLQGIVGKPVDLSSAPSAPQAYTAGATPTPLNRNSLPAAPTAYQGASNLPAMPAASDQLRQRVIDAQMQRANSSIDKQQESTQSDLIAKGIRPGTEAYAREMDAIGRQRNDAQAQAEANATSAVQAAFGEDLARRQQGYQEGITDANTRFGQGMQLRGTAAGEQAQNFNQTGQASELGAREQSQQFSQDEEARQRAIGEMLMQRQMPLNEVTALMSGSQVANPFAGGGGFAGSNVAPAPIFAAGQAGNQWQQDVYNSQVGTANTQQAAGASILTAVIAAY